MPTACPSRTSTSTSRPTRATRPCASAACGGTSGRSDVARQQPRAQRQERTSSRRRARRTLKGMDRATRDALIEQYRDGATAVRKAVAEVGEDGLDRRPEPGEWTAREVVHHLADS